MNKIDQLKEYFENGKLIVFEIESTNGRSYKTYEDVTAINGNKVTVWELGQKRDLDKLITLDFSKYEDRRIEFMM